MARTVSKKSSTPGVSFVQEMGGIKEFALEKNGLRILLVKDDSVPVAGCMVTYHVGSKNEATGYTGATHLLEHLMFKGSENFNRENHKHMEHLMESQGALLNASTWLDRTNYYEVIPRDVLPLAIEIEADRMRKARITEEDKQSEMPIVRNEYERGENLPMEALDKEMWAAAFIAHPYHHSTIGWRSDIEGVSIERLNQFYNDFYWPDNATVTIVGSFKEDEVLAHIAREFGKHSRKEGGYPKMYTEEPKQEGQRRVRVERSGVNMVGFAHKIPEATHTDIPALIILAVVLYEDKTSRLYKSFVEPALATEVAVMCNQFQDPSLFETFITLAPKTSHEKAEQLLKKEYDLIADKGITTTELKRAKQAARAFVASRRDGPYALLASLNEDLAAGDWTRFVTLPDAIESVTAADVKRVAKTYFKDQNSVVGWFVNTAE
ncbi:MAG: peptidase domain protein [Parcubacteria group bacterium]|nr:peptidase domain protein [Parcubacteria group bacterium]